MMFPQITNALILYQIIHIIVFSLFSFAITKNFYVMADIEDKFIITPKLSDLLMDYYYAVKTFLEFLTESLQ